MDFSPIFLAAVYLTKFRYVCQMLPPSLQTFTCPRHATEWFEEKQSAHWQRSLSYLSCAALRSLNVPQSAVDRGAGKCHHAPIMCRNHGQ